MKIQILRELILFNFIKCNKYISNMGDIDKWKNSILPLIEKKQFLCIYYFYVF